MKKALLVTTVSGFIPQFEMNNVRLLRERGYEIHYAANYNMPVYGDNSRLDGTGIVRHQVDFVKSPFSPKNIKVYKQLKAVVRELNSDGELKLVHCHTPMGGAMARIVAAPLRKHGTRVLYTAHGFHFYKGAKVINYVIYYTAEKLLSKLTDVLVTINQEDYKAAKKFHAKHCAYIPGIGMSLNRIDSIECDRDSIRKSLGLGQDDYVLVSVGELSKRKNHKAIIEALTKLRDIDKLKYVICGSGATLEALKKQVSDNNLSDKVIFAGYRKDAISVVKAADLFVFPSLQEGLPVAVMEAMAVGIPVVASRIRGNEDLVDDISGTLIEGQDATNYAAAIRKYVSMDKSAYDKIAIHSREVLKGFTLDKVESVMKDIYDEKGNGNSLDI